jgi:hypothetical protein
MFFSYKNPNDQVFIKEAKGEDYCIFSNSLWQILFTITSALRLFLTLSECAKSFRAFFKKLSSSDPNTPAFTRPLIESTIC